MMSFTSDQWVIVALVFVLGLLVGGFLFAGGGRKWRHRYNAEVARRREIEAAHADAERGWREQDSLRAAALKDRGVRDTEVVRDRDVARERVAEDELRRDEEIARTRDVPPAI